MSVDVRPVCSQPGECQVQIEQTVDMVLDIDRSKRPRGKWLTSYTLTMAPSDEL